MFSVITFVKFIHVIASMVYFGLPFIFGRWFSNISGGAGDLKDGLDTMKLISSLHLNLCAFILLATGMYLVIAINYWNLSSWPAYALVLLVLSVINVNFTLGHALRTASMNLKDGLLEPRLRQYTRLRISIFTAIHHTLVTGATALMVFRA